MIEYPDDSQISKAAKDTGIPAPVLVRDLVRVVEVLNLRAQGFFSKGSVLAGSMALRSFGSPRFTVYDADFSTSTETVAPPTQMKKLLAYSDDELDINPSDLTPSADGGQVWQSSPVDFDPAFTDLAPEGERTFKVDVSFRGLLLDGHEVELKVPYALEIFVDRPVVFVMDPHETLAEKVLGWCAYRLVKHYADIGFIAIVSQPGANRLIELNGVQARETLAGKLELMRESHPARYEAFADVGALIDDLDGPPQLSRDQWAEVMYVRARRDRFSPQLIERAVRQLLVPLLRG